ncbi:hypothetical protein EON80_27375 [bacterium]|nr:MAG: hypothetical protein EON80_27375 [bacterium]
MTGVVDRLNTLLGSHDECRIQSFDSWRIIIIGSFDIGYYHDFEVEFGGATYINCLTDFHAQSFRLGTAAERVLLGADYLEPEETLFCFESDGRNFFIVAATLVLREGHVKHY